MDFRGNTAGGRQFTIMFPSPSGVDQLLLAGDNLGPERGAGVASRQESFQVILDVKIL